jgi:hypothetical protein
MGYSLARTLDLAAKRGLSVSRYTQTADTVVVEFFPSKPAAVTPTGPTSHYELPASEEDASAAVDRLYAGDDE